MDVVEMLSHIHVLLKVFSQYKYFYTADFWAGKSLLLGLIINILGLIRTLWHTFAGSWFLESTFIGDWVATFFVYNYTSFSLRPSHPFYLLVMYLLSFPDSIRFTHSDP